MIQPISMKSFSGVSFERSDMSVREAYEKAVNEANTMPRETSFPDFLTYKGQSTEVKEQNKQLDIIG